MNNISFSLPVSWQYRAIVVRIVDGDTIDVIRDCGANILDKMRIRLLDLDTPEVFGVKKGSEEYQKGIRASEALAQLILGKEVLIKTVKDRTGKYGRYLATVFVPCEDQMMDVVHKMKELGHHKEND